MKRFGYFIALGVIAATPVWAADGECNVQDQSSVCTLHLTVAEINMLNAAFSKAPIPYEQWSPTWLKIIGQVQLQQPKRPEKK